MKNTIKNWLGITKIEKQTKDLESVVGKEEEKKESATDVYTSMWSTALAQANGWFMNSKDPVTLTEKYSNLLENHKTLRENFNELDNKIDHLERYLQVEFFKTSSETQVYDWSEKKKKEGYRKTKSYKEIKKSKEGCGYISDCDNDE